MRDIHTLCRAFGSGDDITCFNDVGLSRLGFEHSTFRFQSERSNPLRHGCGYLTSVERIKYTH